MRILLAILRKELLIAWGSPLAWSATALGLALLAWLFLTQIEAFQALAPQLASASNAPGLTDLVAAPFATAIVGVLVYLAPLLTMRSVADERRLGTLGVLLASGVGEFTVVIAKWLAVWLELAVIVMLAMAMPMLLKSASDVDLARIAVAGLGAVLAAAAFAATGVLASSLSRHPAAAAAGGLAINVLLWMLDSAARARGETGELINALAMPTHLQRFGLGIVSLVDCGYFVLLIAVCLALAARRVARTREAG